MKYKFAMLLLTVLFSPASSAQQPASDQDQTPEKRLLWVIPNFRTSPSLKEYKPLQTRQKFDIAAEDTFDRGTVALAAAIAGAGQLSNSNPSFGQGVGGYAHYMATTYGDFMIGNYLTEAIFPTVLHQDPRYFRRGTGSKLSRLGYAAGQIFWTHNDSGKSQFNYSEIGGNSAAVAISMAYYPDSRRASDAASKLGTQLGIDMATNILKEFWPGKTRKQSKAATSDAP